MVVGNAWTGQLGYYVYLNELGRDSLRAILTELKGLQIALPDFHCPIIKELMDVMGIDYKMYHINKDLAIDWSSVGFYDVFYSIRYNDPIAYKLPDDVILLEDNCFHRDFEPCHPKYIGFNSWRKCTPLTHGSLIKSTIPLKDSYWKLPPQQLALLLQGQTTKYEHHWLSNRDEVQKKLADNEIYLPVFWRGTSNDLSDHNLSIPIDIRYTDDEIKEIRRLFQ